MRGTVESVVAAQSCYSALRIRKEKQCGMAVPECVPRRGTKFACTEIDVTPRMSEAICPSCSPCTG